jgi:hypothetical protein
MFFEFVKHFLCKFIFLPIFVAKFHGTMFHKSNFKILKSINFMNTSNRYLSILFFLLTFISCKKVEKTAKDFLIGDTWYIVELWEDHGNDGNFDDVDDNDMGDCESDNTLSFISGSELVINNGPLKCSPDEASTVPGIWTLSADEKTLTLSDDKYTSPFVLFSLTADQMELHEIEDGRIEMRIVLKKQ